MIYRSDEIKSSLKIEDVIQTYTGQTLTGGRMCCPFHNEKTASFFVNKKKQFFKCFGCGEGGDVITFVMKFFGIDFKNAIKKLSGDFSVSGTSAPPEEIISRREEARRRDAFNEWKHDTFVLMCEAYHIGEEFLKEQNRGFFFDRLTDDYLYIINHLDLLGHHIDIMIDDPVWYYNNYGEEGKTIAREIFRRIYEGRGDNPSVSRADSSLYTREPVTRCGGDENKQNDIGHSFIRGHVSYDNECRRQFCG